MTNLVFVLLLCLLSCKQGSEIEQNLKPITQDTSKQVLAIETEKIVYDIIETGYFDYDNTIDTIKGIYTNAPETGDPLAKCTVYLKNTTREIVIAYMKNDIQVHNSEKGCIETYEWITGVDGYEKTNIYIYDEQMKDWYIKSTVIFENEKEQIITPDEIWNISGTIKK